jgi:hypothetical protein
MKNSQKGFIVPLIIVIILVSAIGGGFYFHKNKSTGTVINNVASNIESETVIQTTNIERNVEDVVSSAPKNSDKTAPVSMYNNEMVNQCVNAYQSEQQKYKREISSGYVVVGFPSNTSLAVAKEIIKSHNLLPRETTVGYHSYLYADVTTGQEYLWACRLKQDPRVRYAEPSPVSTI